MGRPRTKSDDEILETARSCFLEFGPGVPTQRIAEEVGLSQPALFRRFGSKQELMLQALMPPAEPPWLETVRSGVDDRPIVDQLVEVGVAASRYFGQMTPAMMMLRASGIEPRAILERYDVPPPVTAIRMLTAWFSQAMEEGRIRRLDAQEVAIGFIGTVHGRCFLQHIGAGLPVFNSVEDSIRIHCDALCLGLLPEESSQ